jgi:hypothetical protein
MAFSLPLRVHAALAAVVLVAACGGSREAPPPGAQTAAPAAPARATDAPVQVEMKNVRLHVAEGVVLNIRSLRGQMENTVAGEPPSFGDPRSYRLHVFSADLGMDMASLTNLMNHHILAYEDAPLKDVSVEIDEGKLKQKGKMHKGVWMPFSMKASVSATGDGRLRLHADSISALGIPATKLLDLFGIKLEDLASLEKDRGVEIKDDDVIIAPGRALPPPAIVGRLSRAEIAGGELRQIFSSAAGREGSALTPPDRSARNYLYFSGSVLRFGKLTMTGADLQLIDSDPKDVFDLFPARYNAQLVAGYSKNTPEGGLKTYMPDYNDLRRGASR